VERAADIHLCVTDESNQNLSEPQKELLRWHFRLGHINFDSIQLLLWSGALATSIGTKLKHKAAGSCPHPKCASCMYGKQKRSRTPGSVSQKDKSDGNLKKMISFQANVCPATTSSAGSTSPESSFTAPPPPLLCLVLFHQLLLFLLLWLHLSLLLVPLTLMVAKFAFRKTLSFLKATRHLSSHHQMEGESVIDCSLDKPSRC
jgi:GAG-pre-integrase domain